MKIATGFDERREIAEQSAGWGISLLSAVGLLIMCAAFVGAALFIGVAVRLIL